MSDLGIYWNAYWLKIRAQDRTVLARVPPELVTVKGGLGPGSYTIDLGARRLVYDPSEVVHFRGYNPDSPSVGYRRWRRCAGFWRKSWRWGNTARAIGRTRRECRPHRTASGGTGVEHYSAGPFHG